MHEASRKRLPRRREGVRHSVEVAGAEMFLTINTFEDGAPGEVWAKWGKEGSTSGGLMDAVSILMSIALQYGCPPAVIVEKLMDMRFEPMGMTDDEDVPQASSVMDWLARRFALDVLPADQRAKLGIYSVDEHARTLSGGQSAVDEQQPADEQPASV